MSAMTEIAVTIGLILLWIWIAVSAARLARQGYDEAATEAEQAGKKAKTTEEKE